MQKAEENNAMCCGRTQLIRVEWENSLDNPNTFESPPAWKKKVKYILESKAFMCQQKKYNRGKEYFHIGYIDTVKHYQMLIKSYITE